MNNIFFPKGVFWLLTFTALSVVGSELSAIAQTADTASSKQLTQPVGIEASPNQVGAEIETANQNVSYQSPIQSTSIVFDTERVSVVTAPPQLPTSAVVETASSTLTPIPGTTSTSSVALASQSASQFPKSTSQPSAQNIPPRVAQADIDPGRPTRGGRSYVGVAANIGLGGGDSALGDGNFMVISKIGFTNVLSVRPSAVLGDNTTILVPVTYDFSFNQVADPFSEPLPIAPYVGAGAAIKTGDNSKVGFLISGGVDVPLTNQFTATAAVNAAFFDQTDLGLTVGVGYNFGRF
ncbi:MAG: hypothetical protein ACHBN1_24075 [Heteroscytonema crispum UTEX LB 1556]